jgi:monoamine oxidase
MWDVIIVGAGAAGLTAGYALSQSGLSILILEANNQTIGGRLRKDNTTFGFPVDLGGEWIHTHPSNLNKIVSHELPFLSTIKDASEAYIWDGIRLSFTDEGENGDYRWVNYTWWDFFNDEVASHVDDRISLGCPVRQIDYSQNLTRVKCGDETAYQAKYVVITTSIRVLQDETIEFVPPLPSEYNQALKQFQMEPAIKVFIEFEAKFYPHFLYMARDYQQFSQDESSPRYFERLFYDETNGENTSVNVMGMFAFSRAADAFVNSTSDAIIEVILTELDQVFDGQASRYYKRHTVQNWPNESFIRTGYTRWVLDDPGPIQVMQKPVDGKLFFAGEALPDDLENWGYAHEAAFSGQYAARRVLQSSDCFQSGHSSRRLLEVSILGSALAWMVFA